MRQPRVHKMLCFVLLFKEKVFGGGLILFTILEETSYY